MHKRSDFDTISNNIPKSGVAAAVYFFGIIAFYLFIMIPIHIIFFILRKIFK